MSFSKKYQVFVSSTFKDLKDERQAAVTAILSSGNIPAGMELFSSGDEEQMELIKQWIDDSDIYFLILGTRYGSVDKESDKSYTQLEYEYALSKKMPLFALIIDDTNPEFKVKVEEQDEKAQIKYFEFRNFIEKKHIRYWKNMENMQFEILKSINHFERTKKMAGWVKGSNVYDYGQMADQLSRLSSDNAELREKLSSYIDKETYNGLGYDEMMTLLNDSIEVDLKRNSNKNLSDMNAMLFIRDHYKKAEFTLLHYMWVKRNTLSIGAAYSSIDEFIALKLFKYGLLRYEDNHGSRKYFLSNEGQKFVSRLELILKPYNIL